MSKKMNIKMLAALLPLVSCSVKEARTHCPCRLEISFQPRAETKPGNSCILLVSYPDTIERRRIAVEKWAESPAIFSVPKTLVKLSASCAPGTVLSNLEFTVPKGFQADSIYSCLAAKNCLEEDAQIGCRLLKQFASLTVWVKTGDPSSRFPYKVIVRSSVCGMNLLDLSPVCGDFEYEMHPDFEKSDTVRLFRLAGGELMLDMVRTDSGETVASINLMDELLAAGYDWNAPELADMTAAINMEMLKFSVNVDSWTDGLIELEL